MKVRWFRRGQVARRLLLSVFCFVLLLGIFSLAWLSLSGESFFSLTRRVPAEALVVEGWVGSDGLRAAAEEFERGGYQWIVTTGGVSKEEGDRADYAAIAGRDLVDLKISPDRIIVAPAGQVERQRTYSSAVAAWKALRDRGIRPRFINVLTLGPHARRTALVYAKVFRSDAQVGIIAFIPSSYAIKPWWQSEKRTKCLLKEVVGYPFEVLLNSGRRNEAPGESISAKPGQQAALSTAAAVNLS